MDIINLHGIWRYETDDKDIGISEKFFKRKLKNDGFTVPGSACDNKIGAQALPFTEMTKETVRSLIPKYDYKGALWLQTDFECEDLTNKDVCLFLERVNIASDCYIDGEKIGRQIIEISTPHIYDLSKKLTKGKHTLTLRIDNRDLLNIEELASGYSFDTQSIWLGIIGKAEIRIKDIANIDALRVFPYDNKIRCDVVINSSCSLPDSRIDAVLSLSVTAPDGTRLQTQTHNITLFNRKQTVHIDYPIENPMLWDEYNTNLYTVTATLKTPEGNDEICENFGMRRVWVKDKQLMINNKPLSLRGTTDCAIFPLTGYPPHDEEFWLSLMKTVKEYGLNFVRFHSWVPPHAAFSAADKLGVYILCEMPLWLNYDVCTNDAGGDMIHRDYYTREALNISHTFGNHPSFIMFSNGNELLGDFAMLEDITTQIKALDDRRLYTMTSNFDHPAAPCEDFLLAFEIYGQRVRLQVFHDVISEDTCINYDKAVNASPLPIISFEVGQYCVYPDVDSTKDYTGNLLPLNFEIIKKDMINKGIYHRLSDYIYASGRFSTMMYKEELEAALRTKGMGGISLLSLTDYTGQGTATIGALDAFYKPKGFLEAEEFCRYSSDIVPLFEAKRLFKNTDTLNAKLGVYNNSENQTEDILYTLTLSDNGNTVYETKTKDNTVSIPLDFIKKPTMLTVTLSALEHSNSWYIFVYTDDTSDFDVPVIRTKSELEHAIKNKQKCVFSMDADNAVSYAQGVFKPIFWSPAYFKSTRTSGMLIHNDNPLFDNFPTMDIPSFQWKHPVDKSISLDISSFPHDFYAIVEPIPNFFENIVRSPLFEADIDGARILFTGFDLSADDMASVALKNAMAKYVNSDKFKPKYKLDKDVILKLIK